MGVPVGCWALRLVLHQPMVLLGSKSGAWEKQLRASVIKSLVWNNDPCILSSALAHKLACNSFYIKSVKFSGYHLGGTLQASTCSGLSCQCALCLGTFPLAPLHPKERNGVGCPWALPWALCKAVFLEVTQMRRWLPDLQITQSRGWGEK